MCAVDSACSAAPSHAMVCVVLLMRVATMAKHLWDPMRKAHCVSTIGRVGVGNDGDARAWLLIEWQAPQYVLMTAAEVLFSIAVFEFPSSAGPLLVSSMLPLSPLAAEAGGGALELVGDVKEAAGRLGVRGEAVGKGDAHELLGVGGEAGERLKASGQRWWREARGRAY